MQAREVTIGRGGSGCSACDAKRLSKAVSPAATMVRRERQPLGGRFAPFIRSKPENISEFLPIDLIYRRPHLPPTISRSARSVCAWIRWGVPLARAYPKPRLLGRWPPPRT